MQETDETFVSYFFRRWRGKYINQALMDNFTVNKTFGSTFSKQLSLKSIKWESAFCARPLNICCQRLFGKRGHVYFDLYMYETLQWYEADLLVSTQQRY